MMLVKTMNELLTKLIRRQLPVGTPKPLHPSSRQQTQGDPSHCITQAIQPTATTSHREYGVGLVAKATIILAILCSLFGIIVVSYLTPLAYATPPAAEINGWTTTNALPQALANRNLVVHGEHLLVIGGKNAAEMPSAAIYAARMNPDGSLGEWRISGQLPVALYLHATVVADDKLFVIGGWDGTNTRSDVWQATIHANGDVGNWAATSNYPVGLDLHDAVLINGHIYVVGGWDGAAPLQGIYVAAVTNNGLSSWQQIGTLPTPLYRLAVAGFNGNLYVTGGFDHTQNGAAAVWTVPTNGTNQLGAWRSVTSLPNARYYHKALIHDNRLVVLGGQNEGGTLNQVLSASIAADGLLGSWQAEIAMPEALYRFGAVAVKRNGSDLIYITAGLRSETDYRNNVYHSTAPLPPTATPTATPTPTPTATPTPLPALRLHLSSNPTSWLAPGEEARYTIIYENAGTDVLNDVEISNVIPAGVELVEGSIQSTAGDFTTSGTVPGSRILWTIGDVGTAGSGEVTYQVRRQVMPTPAVPLALEVVASGPATATANEEIVYTFELINQSPLVLNALTLTNTVPLGARYVRGADQPPIDGIVHWALPTLAADSSAQVQYVITASASVVNHDYRVVTNEGVNARGRAMVVTKIDDQPPKVGDGFIMVNQGATASWGVQRQRREVVSNPAFNPSHTLYLPVIQR